MLTSIHPFLLNFWILLQLSSGIQNFSHPLGQRSTDEELLLQYLFKRYNPSARPVLNSSDTVQVSIQFSLMHIKDLDIRSQIFTTTGLLILEWTDERLTWQPSQYNNIEEIIIEVKILWKPEFAVINGAEKIYEEYNQFRAVVSHYGLVHWEPGGVFATMCEIDITFYPFDRQRCELKFGAWSYHTNKMNLTVPLTRINLDYYKKNGEWEVEGTTAKRHEFSYECCPEQRFSNIAFVVYLRRRHLFYVMNVIMPSIMTSILLLSIFFCTPAQKVQIGVVVLLSFRIFLLNVAGNIPKTSDHIPLLVIYLTCTLAITTMSMVLTVLVLNLYGVADRPVPFWMKKVFLVHLAKMLGMCETSKTYYEEVFAATVESMTTPAKPVGRGFGAQKFATTYVTNNRTPVTLSNSEDSSKQQTKHGQERGEGSDNRTNQQDSHAESSAPADHRIDQLCIPSISSDGLRTPQTPQSIKSHTDQSIPQSSCQPRPVRQSPPPQFQESQQPSAFTAAFQLQLLQHLTPTFRLPKNKDPPSMASALNYSREWTRLAEVFDRLFFWLFLAAIVLSTLGLFHPILFDKKPTFDNKN